MKALNKEETEVLKLLLNNKKTLENFLDLYDNPRFLPYLNGNNKQKINIFNNILNKPEDDIRRILSYLKKISENLAKIKEPKNAVEEEYAILIYNIAKDIISQITTSTVEILWWIKAFSLEIINNLDLKYFDKEIFDSLKIYIDKKYINEILVDKEISKILQKIIDSNLIKKEYEDFVINILNAFPSSILYNNRDFIFAIKKLLNEQNIEKIETKFSDEFIKQLCSILTTSLNSRNNNINKKEILYKDWSALYYPKIFDDLKDHYPNKIAILIYLIKNIFLTKARKSKSNETFYKEFITLTNKEPYHVFYRILLFCYGSCFKKYRTQMMCLLRNNKELFFGDSEHFKAEIYDFFKLNRDSFSNEDINIITEIIDNGPYFSDDWKKTLIEEHKIDLNLHKIYWQQKQYYPLKEKEPFKYKYDELYKKTKEDIKPHFNSFEAKFITEKFPFVKEEFKLLLETNIKEFINKINSFDKNYVKDNNDFFHEKPTIKGLEKELSIIAQENPQKILDNILKLKDIKINYLIAIFEGLAFTKQEQLSNWSEIFSFISYFIQNKQDIKNEDFDYLIENFARFVNGRFNDKDKIPNLLILLQNLTKYIKPKNINEKDYDYLTQAINSSLGNIIECIIYLISIDKKNWPSCKDFFNELLEKNIFEFYVLFGCYYANFINFNKKWTLETCNIILKSNLWNIFFEGFLYKHYVYLEDYKLMYKHYIKAIEENFTGSHNILSDSIAIFYLEGVDKLESSNSMFIHAIKEKHLNLVASVIRYIGNELHTEIFKESSKNETEEKKERTKLENKSNELWNFVWHDYKKNIINNLDWIIVNEQLITLIPSLEELDYNNKYRIELLLKNNNIKNFSVEYHLLSNLLYLVKKKEKLDSVKFIGELYLDIIKQTRMYIKDEEEKEILKLLFKYSCNDVLEEIKNFYLGNNLYTELNYLDEIVKNKNFEN